MLIKIERTGWNSFDVNVFGGPLNRGIYSVTVFCSLILSSVVSSSLEIFLFGTPRFDHFVRNILGIFGRVNEGLLVDRS